MSELSQKIEALLFISSSPVTESELKNALSISARTLRNALEELSDVLNSENHGILLRQIAGGWVLETRPEFADIISAFRNDEREKRIHLSKAAIETAAIIAYNQPVTRSEIDEIRGVNSGSPLAKLLELGIIKTAGRKKEGRPSLLYATTPKFLEVFGLDSLENLPAIDEIEIDEIEIEKIQEIQEEEIST